MTRSIKKIIFGSLYLGIIATVVFGIYSRWFEPVPTCSDRIQNQGEAGVDCSGPCTSCEILRLKPVKTSEAKVFQQSSGRVVILTSISNPNEQYGAAPLSYQFVIRGKDGAVLQTIAGATTLYELETKYVYEANVHNRVSDIGTVLFVIQGTRWRPTRELLRPTLSEPQNIITSVQDNVIKVTGTVRNQGALDAVDVRIIALLGDVFGLDVFPSQTVFTKLGGFEERPFVISFPIDENLASRIDPGATKVFVASQ